LLASRTNLDSKKGSDKRANQSRKVTDDCRDFIRLPILKGQKTTNNAGRIRPITAIANAEPTRISSEKLLPRVDTSLSSLRLAMHSDEEGLMLSSQQTVLAIEQKGTSLVRGVFVRRVCQPLCSACRGQRFKAIVAQ
jgi:hypothetical protein